MPAKERDLSLIASLMAGQITRRQFVIELSALGLSAGAIAGLLEACSGTATPSRSSSSTKTYTPVTPEPGTNIPSVDVKFGMRPYADNTFYVIGMVKGWFKDVGIT